MAIIHTVELGGWNIRNFR